MSTRREASHEYSTEKISVGTPSSEHCSRANFGVALAGNLTWCIKRSYHDARGNSLPTGRNGQGDMSGLIATNMWI